MWKLSIISTLLSGALFFGIGLEVGKRWQRAEDTQRARDQLDAALVRAEEQVAELNQKWADAVAVAEEKSKQWHEQDEADRRLNQEILDNQDRLRSDFYDLLQKFNETDTGTCSLSDDAVRLLNDAITAGVLPDSGLGVAGEE
jgi:hypothetical protein